MKNFLIIYTLLSLVLVSSVEASIDQVSSGHPHESEQSHELASFDPHKHTGNSDQDQQPHCEHCCHGHSSGMTNIGTTVITFALKCNAPRPRDRNADNLAFAPPTPPPNL